MRLPKTPAPSKIPMTLTELKEQDPDDEVGEWWMRRRTKAINISKNEESSNRNRKPDRVASHFTLTPPSFLEPI